MSFENIDEMKDALSRIAADCVSKGPGYAQEGVVLREARASLRPQTLKDEQMILEAWHGMFTNGELVWGYDLDNPGSPFFHAVNDDSTVHQVASAMESE